MRKKLLSVMLCLCICLLGFTGCKIGENDADIRNTVTEDAKTDAEVTTTEEIKTEEIKTEDLDIAEQETEVNLIDDSWKAAYLEKLTELRQTLPEDSEMSGDQNTPCSYIVYDVDNDKLPELIVEFGTCEADYNGKLYAFEDGAVVEKDEFGMGHTVLYSVPRDNGILFNWGHMGYAYIQKATLTDGKLQYEELLSEELDPDSDDYYTNPSELISGSCYLSMCRISQDVYITNYEEISRNIVNTAKVTEEDELISNYIGEIVPDIFENNGKVYAVSADGYGGDLGPDTEIEYLLTHLDLYRDITYQVEDSAYLDVNGDKEPECVLKLVEEGNSSSGIKWCVISVSDGTCYAYVINYSGCYDLLENGTFVSADEFYYPFRIAFDHENCTTYTVGNDTTHAVVFN